MYLAFENEPVYLNLGKTLKCQQRSLVNFVGFVKYFVELCNYLLVIGFEKKKNAANFI